MFIEMTVRWEVISLGDQMSQYLVFSPVTTACVYKKWELKCIRAVTHWGKHSKLQKIYFTYLGWLKIEVVKTFH